MENGSLEDWLRRTAGGKRYIPPVKMVIGKNNKKRKKKVSLAEVTHRGYNYNRKCVVPPLLLHHLPLLTLSLASLAQVRRVQAH